MKRTEPSGGLQDEGPPKHKDFIEKASTNMPSKTVSGFIKSIKRSDRVQNKKLKFRLNDRKALPVDYEDVVWEKLKRTVDAVFGKSSIQFMFEELYNDVDNLISHKKSERLYMRLNDVIVEHVVAERDRLISVEPDELKFLPIVSNSWDDFCKNLIFIRTIFLCLDRKYAVLNPEVLSLWDMGVSVYKDNIVTMGEINEKIISGILFLIRKDRTGETIDYDPVKNILRMLSTTELYVELFETRFLTETREFYASESRELLELSPVSDCLVHFNNRIKEESDRCTYYLNTQTKKELSELVENVLIKENIEIIIDKGFSLLMDNDQYESLSIMYDLIDSVEELDQLKSAWNAYIKEKGSQLISNREDDENMIENLLKYKNKVEQILQKCFHHNDNFTYSLKEGFEHFINSREDSPPELLAKYIHRRLISTKTKFSSDTEMDESLDNVIQIFRYCQNKDVFEGYYKKDLAKRLLLNKSISLDAERGMISRLKTECGAQFTSKLEGMFKDINLSDDILYKFKNSEYAGHITEIDLKVSVLTTGYWPVYTQSKMNLPQEMSVCLEIFEKYYCEKFNGRKLFWQNGLSSCVVRATFPKGRKEFHLSLSQAVILLLFNSNDRISYKEIIDSTEITAEELPWIMLSLAGGKVRILQKEPNHKKIESTDLFHWRKNFTSKQKRIRFNNFQLSESRVEKESTRNSIAHDRIHQIDAAIVRIMKTRKTLTHSQLLSEVFSQLKFNLDTTTIKKRIEVLITRDYLGRDDKDTNQFHYKA